MLETFLQDARFATRLLIKSPLFAITAALSLAIGMGALWGDIKLREGFDAELSSC